MSDIDPGVLARVKALFAKAEATDNAFEAEAYSAKAAELMDKYRIDAALLSPDEVPTFGQAVYPMHRHKYLRASLQLLVVVATHYGAVVVTPSTGNSKLPRLVGTKADLEMAVLMFESLLRQRDHACLAEDVPAWTSTTTFRNSFCYGYAGRINKRLRELRERQAEQYIGNTKALAVLDRAAVAKKWLEDEVGDAIGKANRNKAKVDPVASLLGDHAARNADLGQTRVGNETTGPRAIGG
jgi:hypothetical protein